MLGVALVWADNALVLEEKCETNDAEACFKLNKFKKACDLGLAKACAEAGTSSAALDSIPFLKKACELGDMESCKKALDRMTDWEEYWRGYRNSRVEEEEYEQLYKQELEQARVLLRKLCFDDEVETMCSRATYQKTNIDERGLVKWSSQDTYLFSSDERTKFKQKLNELFKISLQEDSKKCDEGEIEICLVLGEMFFKGKGVSKDLAKAREFFQKACDAGDTQTCKKYELTQDTSKFKAILQKACDSGNQNACPKLGELYFSESKNTSKDKAKELYQKACDLGSANGCYELAVSYNIGRGVSQDINKAKELYKKACDLEESSACENFKRLSK